MGDDAVQVLIVGDSHSVALKDGCDALGIRAELLSFSGNFWHEGHIFFHRHRGLWARGRALQERIETVAERLGSENVLGAGVPVLASVGFHLGRIVPPFGFNGHTGDPADFAADPEAHFASGALVAAYARHFRQPQVDLLKRMARKTQVVAVAPPRIYGSGNYPLFRAALGAMITAAGVPLADPCAALFPSETELPQALRTDDGVHGNAEYGVRALRMMIERGLIAA